MESNMHKCLICGGPAIAGRMDCPQCQKAAENRRLVPQSTSELRPVWNNASHDGPPSGYRIIGGPYHGTIVKAVIE